ncbi:thioredoxin-like protein [Melampsora americana]|nr:thioredoxin-like protein [Melampsora americana]
MSDELKKSEELTSSSNYYKLESPTQLQEILSVDLEKLSVLYFRAEWAQICKTADPRFKSLAAKWNGAIFLEIEAETLPEVSESFDVSSVPCFIVLRGHKLLSKIVGAQVDRLEADVEKFLKLDSTRSSNSPNGRYEPISNTTQAPEPPSASTASRPQENKSGNDDESEEEVFARCRKLMQQSKVVLFMKGDPQVPRCGFSQQTVKILKDLNIEFTTFDILTDDSIRQGMKKLNSWPTFPQLIIKGELVGGLDILKEMIEKNGKETSELEDLLAD